jgi:hypothetical protein
MKPPTRDAWARQRTGGSPPVPDRGGDKNNLPSTLDVEREIARLAYRGTICGWPGANCIAPIHLQASVAICSSEPSPMICKSEPMAA